MKVIPTVAALLLFAAPGFAQSAPQSPPPPALNEVNADNQEAGRFVAQAAHCAGGAEQALRHQIESIQSGQPDYGAMLVSTANQLHYQIDKMQPSLGRQWGALVSLKLRRSGAGTDVYETQFEHARVQWEIACQNSQGKITGIAFKTLS
jgi:hypothetical protein